MRTLSRPLWLALVVGLIVTPPALAAPGVAVAPEVRAAIDTESATMSDLAARIANAKAALLALEAAQRAAEARKRELITNERTRLGLPTGATYQAATGEFVTP